MSYQRVTPAQAAEMLGVKEEQTLAAWRNSGRGPAWYEPSAKLIFYRAEDIQAYLQSTRRDPSENVAQRTQRPFVVSNHHQEPGGRVKNYSLAGTNSSRTAAQKIHNERRAAILAQGKSAVDREKLTVAEAAAEFLEWTENVEYRSTRNTYLRIKTSFASLTALLGETPVVRICPADMERYKTWRITTHRDVTLRHDLHAASLFFQYARKAQWLSCGPLEGVKISSDRESRRQHVLTVAEVTEWLNMSDGWLAALKHGRSFVGIGLNPEYVKIAHSRLNAKMPLFATDQAG